MMKTYPTNFCEILLFVAPVVHACLRQLVSMTTDVVLKMYCLIRGSRFFQPT